MEGGGLSGTSPDPFVASRICGTTQWYDWPPPDARLVRGGLAASLRAELSPCRRVCRHVTICQCAVSFRKRPCCTRCPFEPLQAICDARPRTGSGNLGREVGEMLIADGLHLKGHEVAKVRPADSVVIALHNRCAETPSFCQREHPRRTGGAIDHYHIGRSPRLGLAGNACCMFCSV